MELQAQREVNRDPAEVFAFLADASNNPRWQNGMRRCDWATDGPIAVGSEYEQEARFMGRPVVSRFVVKELDADRRILIDTVESTFPITVERSVDPLPGGGSRITARITGGPRVPKPLAGLVRRMAQRSVDADYDRLVHLLDGG